MIETNEYYILYFDPSKGQYDFKVNNNIICNTSKFLRITNRTSIILKNLNNPTLN